MISGTVPSDTDSEKSPPTTLFLLARRGAFGATALVADVLTVL